MKKFISIIITIVIANLNCLKPDVEKSIPFKEFELYNKYFHNNGIPLDGVYLSTAVYDGLKIHIYLFRDGTIFYSGFTLPTQTMICYQINKESREVPYWWGYFDKEMKELDFELLDPRGGKNIYQLVKIKGRMISDSSFYMIDYFPTGNPERRDTFIFHHCVDKPDSINIINRNISKYK